MRLREGGELKAETKRMHHKAKEERCGECGQKSKRVDWRGKKSRQSLEYQALLWLREKEERRGGVAVKDGEHPQNTKERINARRLFKSFPH